MFKKKEINAWNSSGFFLNKSGIFHLLRLEALLFKLSQDEKKIHIGLFPFEKKKIIPPSALKEDVYVCDK